MPPRPSSWRRRTRTILGAAAAALFVASDAGATIYYSKDEAFEQAFGKDASVELLPVFLTEEQVAAIEQKAKVKLDSQLFTFYEGRQNGQVLGYAAIESHTVRTQAETLLLVLSPDGQLTKTLMLAFHEPPEYQPPQRWYAKFQGRKVEELMLNYGVDGVSGATLSARAALDSARKVLAIFALAYKASEGK